MLRSAFPFVLVTFLCGVAGAAAADPATTAGEDACARRCAGAEDARKGAEARVVKADDEAASAKTAADAAHAEVLALEKAIADAEARKKAAEEAMRAPRTPGADPSELARQNEIVMTARAAIEENSQKVVGARDREKQSLEAAAAATKGATSARAEAEKAKKARDDCAQKCAREASDASEASGAKNKNEAPRKEGGIALGLRAGVGLPFGATRQGVAIGDQYAAMIPFQADVGYRFTPRFYLGAYFQFGVVLRAPNSCKDATGNELPGCSSRNVRFGIEGEYHFAPEVLYNPWVGAGVGYEVASSSGTTSGGDSLSSSVEGFEFLHAQAGLDFRVRPNLTAGPVLVGTFGQYSTGSENGSISGKRFHEWIVLGARGRFELF